MEKVESCEQNNNHQINDKQELAAVFKARWNERQQRGMNQMWEQTARCVGSMSQCMKDTMHSMLRQANSLPSYIMYSVLFLSLSAFAERACSLSAHLHL